MNPLSRSSFRWISLLDLLACALGFLAAMWLYGMLDADYGFPIRSRWAVDLALSGVTAWIGIEFLGGGWRGGLRNAFDLSFCAVGLNLVLQYGLNYFRILLPVPWVIALTGGIFGVAAVGMVGTAFAKGGHDQPSVLLVGFDAVTAALAIPLRRRIIGVLCRDAASVPEEFTLLGDYKSFEEVVAAHQPRSVILTGSDWRTDIPFPRLFDLHCSGTLVEDAPAVYEEVLQRVCWERLRPVDLLLASPVTSNRAVKTLQAVYTNMAGLALLLVTSPLLLVCAFLAMIFNGGPAFETISCCGLQRIPFRLVRFRTRRRNGSLSWMGRALTFLHLANLPQLWNVVRGEMGLFGPPPVRADFAGRLGELIPAYPHRFAVKPGLLGWSQANLRGAQAVPDDCLRLGYDLYYAKLQSPSFDIDILLRTLFRVAGAHQQAGGAG